MIKQVEIHPAANIFPVITGKAFEELVNDIRQHGLKEPIVYYHGKLLDGRNRLRACEVIGIEPDAAEIDDDEGFDPFAWVLSMNLHRRHLTETQREVIAAKVANLKQGGDRRSEEFKPQNCGLKSDPQNCGSASVGEAAEQLNVKPRSVEHAKSALNGGCKKLCEMLEAGEIPSSTAANFVKAVPDKKKQADVLKEGLSAVREAIKEAKQLRQPRTKNSTPASNEPESEAICNLGAIKSDLRKLDYEQLVVVQEYVAALLQKLIDLTWL